MSQLQNNNCKNWVWLQGQQSLFSLQMLLLCCVQVSAEKRKSILHEGLNGLLRRAFHIITLSSGERANHEWKYVLIGDICIDSEVPFNIPLPFVTILVLVFFYCPLDLHSVIPLSSALPLFCSSRYSSHCSSLLLLCLLLYCPLVLHSFIPLNSALPLFCFSCCSSFCSSLFMIAPLLFSSFIHYFALLVILLIASLFYCYACSSVVLHSFISCSSALPLLFNCSLFSSYLLFLCPALLTSRSPLHLHCICFLFFSSRFTCPFCSFYSY